MKPESDFYPLGQDRVLTRHRFERAVKAEDGTESRVLTVSDQKSAMLAVLLIKKEVTTNSHWWEEDWPEEARKRTSLFVNCNDVFLWGCADGEEMNYEDISDVFGHFEKDPSWGGAVWCIKRRGLMPQKPVYDRIKAAGIWDLDGMGLEPNPTWPSAEKDPA